MELKGKRILFFSPKFFGYESEIAKQMEALGAIVDYFDSRYSNSSLAKIVIRLNLRAFDFLLNRYFDRILSKISNNYDYCFVIKGEGINYSCMLKIKNKLKNAYFIYYLWDSVENCQVFHEIHHFFDSCFSFDLLDCVRFSQLKHEPLFYLDKYEKMEIVPYCERNYDFSFIGSMHSDRLIIIYRFIQNLSSDLKFFLYLFYPSKVIFFLFNIFSRFNFSKLKSYVFFAPISSHIFKGILEQTKVTIDINHPKQVGLTMRTIEMMAFERKIVTTNTFILHYDFYSKKNIFVIDRNNPYVPRDFFDSPYEQIPDDVRKKYHLARWILRIFVK